MRFPSYSAQYGFRVGQAEEPGKIFRSAIRLQTAVAACVLAVQLAVATSADAAAWQDGYQEGTAAQSSEVAAAQEGARLFPADTAYFIYLRRPGHLTERVLAHPLRESIEELKPVQDALGSPQWVQFKLGLAFLSAGIGEEWLPALQSLTDGGVFLGAGANGQSAAIAVHAADEELLARTAGTILGFVRSQAPSGRAPYEVEEYAGGRIAVLEQVALGRFGKWLVIARTRDAVTGMADKLATDGAGTTDDSLAQSEDFASAFANCGPSGDAWFYADLDAIRKSGRAPELFARSTDEPGAEFVLGGILEALADAPYVAGDLAVRDDRVVATVQLPYDTANIPREREFFFGTQGAGRAPAPLEIDGLIGQAIVWRDIGGWWLAKEDLFPENVIARLAQTDSQLSTVFGGVDFGEEVLGAVQPGMRLLVKGQSWPDGQAPDIQLPAFALVTRLQNPEQAKRFRISFQSLISLLNLNEGGLERPQIELFTDNLDGVQVTGGKFVSEAAGNEGLMVYNFSPALAFIDDVMVVSSSADFAHEVALAVRAQDPDGSAASGSNTRLTLHGPSFLEALEINRPTLVAQTMVEQGVSHEQAEQRVEAILGILKFLESASVDYRVEPSHMSLDIELQLRNAGGE